MPPMGALKAAATPATAPTATHSRCGPGSRSSSSVAVPGMLARVRIAAHMAPMWTIGPSRPRGRFVLVMRVMPTTLATSVLVDSMPSRMYVPTGWGRGWRPEGGGRRAEGAEERAVEVRLELGQPGAACGGGPQCEQRREEHDQHVEPRVGGEGSTHVSRPLGAIWVQCQVRGVHDHIVQRLRVGERVGEGGEGKAKIAGVRGQGQGRDGAFATLEAIVIDPTSTPSPNPSK